MCQMRTQFKTVEYSLEFNAHRDCNLFVRYLWVSCVQLPHSIALIEFIMSISKYFTLVDYLPLHAVNLVGIFESRTQFNQCFFLLLHLLAQ